jgi:exodeoxyribonuclease VII large subunit
MSSTGNELNRQVPGAMNLSEPSEPRIYSVAELANGISRILEQRTDGLWALGEVGRVQRSPAGHLYFSLKDSHADAMIDCVIYKREATRFGRFIEEGVRVVVRGRASLYAPRGRLQWIASQVKPSGQGELLALLEALKKRLEAEGLFDPARKRALPRSPKVVGVVTSRQGAVFHDICTVIGRRARVRIVLSPATVQGDEAPASLIAAIDRIEALGDLDVLIVGRGGGSQEDLSAFNDESVVRRLARVRVPVVSAVGHETDVTLADWVADVRAATPSEAAELATPDLGVQLRVLSEFLGRLGLLINARLSEQQLRVTRLERDLGDPRFLLVNRQRDLDELRQRLGRRVQTLLRAAQEEQRHFAARLSASHPRAVVLRARADLGPILERLRALGPHILAARRRELNVNAAKLHSLSPLAVLGRGYAVAFGPTGRAVRSSKEVGPGDPVRILVSEGEIHATVRDHTES